MSDYPAHFTKNSNKVIENLIEWQKKWKSHLEEFLIGIFHLNKNGCLPVSQRMTCVK